MVEQTYDDDLWYTNFRVSKNTFEYLLNMIRNDIYRADTTMRSAIPPKRCLALTLYFLVSTAEYRTIGNLFGVSASFVCVCVSRVSCYYQTAGQMYRISKRKPTPGSDRGLRENMGFPNVCRGY